MSEQLELFDGQSLNPVPRVKEAMRRAIKQSGLSRDQVVDSMNALNRVEGLSTNGRAKQISLDMLEKWLSDSADHLLPWKLFPVFCRVVNSINPIKALCAPLNAEVIDKTEAPLLRWARFEMEKRQIKKQQRRLEGDFEN